MPDGSMISFPVNGTQADGYLAVPDGGGPGLLVDPGVVGPRPRHQSRPATASPLKGSSPWRRTSTTVSWRSTPRWTRRAI